jgi:cytochrome c-type biogenesis protein CcmH/NrfF
VRVALPLVVLAVALLIGSGVFSAKPQTPAQRAARIEADVRCPACIDVSVAQSNETTALAVRHEILRMVQRGDTTAEIDRTLVAQYGPTILLIPPATGGVALIWILPAAMAVGAVIVIGVLFVRRSRQFTALRDPEVGVAPASVSASAGPPGNDD